MADSMRLSCVMTTSVMVGLLAACSTLRSTWRIRLRRAHRLLVAKHAAIGGPTLIDVAGSDVDLRDVRPHEIIDTKACAASGIVCTRQRSSGLHHAQWGVSRSRRGQSDLDH